MSLSKEELKAQMMAKAEAAIDKLLAGKKPADEITLTEIEQLALRAGAEFWEKVTGALVKASQDSGQDPEQVCPDCGKPMRYKDRKRKRVVTESGEVEVERAYYYCEACKRGLFPLDERWGLNESRYSESLNRQMVWLCGLVPSYEKASEVFERIGHRDLPKTTLWRRTQAHGETMKQHLEHQQAMTVPERITLPKADPDHAQSKGITMDGGMVHIRGEGWKEFKAGAVFDTEVRWVTDPGTGEEVEKPCAVNTSYTAVLGEVERFAPALWHLAVEADVPAAARSSVTADGAAWIWNLVADYFPDSEQIVDWYHATEHLAAAAHALHPDLADKARAWFERWQTSLFEGEAWRLAQTLERAGLPEQAQYFENHKRRMRYQHFRADGFPIGSGTVESACKQYKARLTGPGMRWSRPGAERMSVIRSAVMSDTFDLLWTAAA